MMNPRFLKKAISIVMAIALLMMSCMPVMAEDIHTVNGEPQKQEAVVASNAGKANEAKEEVKAQSTVAPTTVAGNEGSIPDGSNPDGGDANPDGGDANPDGGETNPKPLAKCDITITPESVIYNGQSQKPGVSVMDGTTPLKEGFDYEVKFSRGENVEKDFINAGKITVEIISLKKEKYTEDGLEPLTYIINPKKLEDVEISLGQTEIVYDGNEHKLVPTVSELSDGEYSVDYESEGKDTPDFTNVGKIGVVVTVTDNPNYTGSKTVYYTITPKSLTDEDIKLTVKEGSITYSEDTAASFTYDGEAHQPDSIVVEMEKKEPETELKKDVDYTVTYMRGDSKTENFTDVGEITVVIEGKGNFKDSRTIAYEIKKLNVALKVADQSKNYGEKTPEFTVGFDATDAEGNPVTVTDKVAEEITEKLSMKVKEVVEGDVGYTDLAVAARTGQVVSFEDKNNELNEEPSGDYVEYQADYTIEAMITLDDNDNFEVNDSTVSATYTITNKIHLTVLPEIESHFAKLTDFEVKPYEKEAMDGFAGMVNLTAKVTLPDNDKLPEGFSIDTWTEEYPFLGSDKEVNLDLTTFSEGKNTWQTYLPVGAEITYEAITEAGNDLYIVDEAKTNVVATSVTIDVSATDEKSFNEGNNYILSKNTGLTITAKHGDASTNADWFEIKCGENGTPLPRQANAEGIITITADEIKTMLAELEQLDEKDENKHRNTNPQDNYAPITITMIDQYNHSGEVTKTIGLCVDTGPVTGGVSTVGNREDNAVCDLLDSVGSITEITGNYGSMVMDATKGNTEGQKLTINLAGWRETPDQLPHSGDVIRITYTDKVGYTVTHTLNIVKSPAKISNTIRVKADDVLNNKGVVGKTLTFTGRTTKCEKLILRIGGETITIDPQKMENPYNSGEYAWVQKVYLDELGIPVGVPQTVTISYDDLAGGEDSTRITYKDHAMKPSLSSDLVKGMRQFWGFVEENVDYFDITINHANGGTTVLTDEKAILLNKTKGYFYVKLDAPLAAGDVVVFFVRDLCGNEISCEQTVGTETGKHKAMLLGANIMDEISININGEIKDEYMHAFATPIDVEKLASYENQSMTLPILAYDAIEIGTMTISLNGTQIDVEYNISEDRFNSTYIPEDAKVYWSTYTEKPTVEELVNGNHRTAKLEMSGALKPIDASVNVDENGEPKGVVWLYAAVDVKVDANVLADPGRKYIKPYIWADRKEIVEKYDDRVSIADKQDDYFALYNDFYNEASRAA